MVRGLHRPRLAVRRLAGCPHAALKLIQITAPHFCAGLIHDDGRVVMAAPILRYMIGWSGLRVASYCKAKGWAWIRVA